jgi:pimeloyl-ACP methyl ester carboxylesterase
MQHIAIPHGTIGVFAQGKGVPILFVHGFPLNHTMWHSQIETFGRSFRVVAPDLRGSGESHLAQAGGTGTLTMEAFADDLHALLHAVYVDRPVVFCGLSMGGYIAWQFFLKYREQVQALILCDTRATADSPEAAAGRRKLAEEILTLGPHAAAEAMLPKLISPKTAERRPNLVADLRTMILRNSPAGIAATLRGMAERPDCTPLLAQVDVPTLVLCGQDDVITPPAEMKQMAEAIPGSQFVEIHNAGHMAPLENPDAVNAAINRFLKTTT